jgi:hypothetical protein
VYSTPAHIPFYEASLEREALYQWKDQRVLRRKTPGNDVPDPAELGYALALSTPNPVLAGDHIFF